MERAASVRAIVNAAALWIAFPGNVHAQVVCVELRAKLAHPQVPAATASSALTGSALLVASFNAVKRVEFVPLTANVVLHLIASVASALLSKMIAEERVESVPLTANVVAGLTAFVGSVLLSKMIAVEWVEYVPLTANAVAGLTVSVGSVLLSTTILTRPAAKALVRFAKRQMIAVATYGAETTNALMSTNSVDR